MIVVLVAQDDGVDGGKRLGPEDPGRMDAVFERVDRAELLAKERIHEHAGVPGPDDPTLMAKKCHAEHAAL